METIVMLVAVGIVLVLQIVLLIRGAGGGRDENKVLQQRLEETERRLTEEGQRSRRETSDNLRQMSGQIADLCQQLLTQSAGQQKESMRLAAEQQEALYRSLNAQSQRLNDTLTDVVGKLQQSNEQKLDQMRATVDEKLTSTLSQRLDSSFKTVGDQLKDVYKSLGEMKELAGGVSDLQRVLTNVKARGTWAEVQLGNLLEQTLTSEQYARNVSIKNNGELVEYAVKIPSRDDDDSFIWLPIDSKFPQEDYLRISEAADRADKDAVEEAAKALEKTLRREASSIASLYIDVPRTTDFAILFLPTEGLYAEVLRRPGLVEELQTKHRVMVCGPTTITAFLNTLRLGFRTIALDKRAAEVWKILGAAKAQYETFETVLLKARRKIDEAGATLEDAQKRNAIIRKRLRTVEEVDSREAGLLLDMGPSGGSDEDAEI